jgi:rubredoxin
MSAASKLALDVPSLLPSAPMTRAAADLAAHAIEALPVVRDSASRRPVGVVRQTDLDGCRAAGHDLQSCLVRNHVSTAYLVAHPDDTVDYSEAASSEAPGVALVVGNDGGLSGVIVAPTGRSLAVTPAYKVEPMIGGMQGMELIWRCGDCGYVVHRPASPPDRCPDCGAPRENFYLVTED